MRKRDKEPAAAAQRGDTGKDKHSAATALDCYPPEGVACEPTTANVYRDVYPAEIPGI